ncbi:hypothetical protein ACSSNL_18645 [Thalassobius sp. S69A]|uniref:hypothetical protein n=1 Tax=unclassified Thalassovita TaxID=2619711 RepID=UPI003C7C7074
MTDLNFPTISELQARQAEHERAEHAERLCLFLVACLRWGFVAAVGTALVLTVFKSIAHHAATTCGAC